MQYDYLRCRSLPFVGYHLRMVLQGLSGGHRKGSIIHRKYIFGMHVPLFMY